MIYAAALAAIELAFLVLASAGRDSAPLRAFVLLNMVLITVFGGIMFPPGMPTSNIGCVFYSFVLAAVMLLFRRDGTVSVVRILHVIVFSILMLLAIAVVLNAMKWDGPAAAAYHEVLEGAYRFSYASLCAFVIGQALYTCLYRKLQHRSVLWYYVVNMILVQAVDTALFFPLAFGESSIDLLPVALNGFFIKVAIGLLLTPFVVFLHRPAPVEAAELLP